MAIIRIQKTDLATHTMDDIRRQHAILIANYAETEKEIWGENYERVSFQEYLQTIKEQNVFTAYIDNEVVGTISCIRESDSIYSFGLLAVDFNFKGKGVGRKLIEVVEKLAIDNGAKHMHLEILKPQSKMLPVKQQLAKWYERMGYHYVDTKTFLALKSDKIEKAKNLITPSVFDCYEKNLNYVSL